MTSIDEATTGTRTDSGTDSRFTADGYVRHRFGDNFEVVLRISQRIGDGATAPVIEDFEQVKAVIKDNLTGAQWDAAKKRSATIAAEWAAEQAHLDTHATTAEWFENLSAAAEAARADGEKRSGLAGLAGLFGGRTGGSDGLAGLDAKFAEAAAESERRRRTALVVAAGPAAVPGQVWDQVLVFAGLGGDTATDTAAEGEVA
ncbi:hypothetical protein [Corynebacterium bovis]|uniref:hypothetical protein n=1 Tax=Corynebacterium bovis TaxID=36808 RepID=UPI000F6353A2|nr:hypothetical protein [Corynebacterium bovis]RRQ06206.1 hypothetical protein CXF43_09845 [Corynebacterium bovis]RRQ09178.1 hypothetical protein CXF44_09045 [Corynebacterium bovis]